MMRCMGCNQDIPKALLVTAAAEPKPKPGHVKKISQVQEKANAKDLGGRVTPASGAGKWQKSDVRSEEVRLECKVTEKASYALKKTELDKVASEAQGDEMPVFSVKFRQPTGDSEYYIVSKDWFLELLQAYREKKNGGDPLD